jgi:hypothetical protein
MLTRQYQTLPLQIQRAWAYLGSKVGIFRTLSLHPIKMEYLAEPMHLQVS